MRARYNSRKRIGYWTNAPFGRSKKKAHPRTASARSGTLSNDPEGYRLPVVEPGLSIDPEDLGRQFLRDATEQDNFESALEAEGEDPSASALAQVISEASLEASAQAVSRFPGKWCTGWPAAVASARSNLERAYST
jgi:hypothetical protein